LPAFVDAKGRAMQRHVQLLRQAGFHVLLFALFLFLLVWPVLSIPGRGSVAGFFAYLFSIWVAAIIFLGSMSWSLGKNKSDGKEESPKG
jgi:hypothetical protein